MIQELLLQFILYTSEDFVVFIQAHAAIHAKAENLPQFGLFYRAGACARAVRASVIFYAAACQSVLCRSVIKYVSPLLLPERGILASYGLL